MAVHHTCSVSRQIVGLRKSFNQGHMGGAKRPSPHAAKQLVREIVGQEPPWQVQVLVEAVGYGPHVGNLGGRLN